MHKRTPAWGLASFVAIGILVGGGLHWWRPLLEQQRPQIEESVGLSPLFSRADVRLRPRERVCITPVALSRNSQVFQFWVTARKRPQPLLLRVKAAGYVASAVADSYVANVLAPVRLSVTGPLENKLGTVCLTNEGRRQIALLGTNEARSLTAVDTTVAGQALKDQDVTLTVYRRAATSMSAKLGTIINRASSLTGSLAPPWFLWAIALLAVIAAPLAIVVAFSVAVRTER